MRKVVTEDSRRRIMQAVRSTDTTPELFVRRLLHAQGYRFRLHRKDLPGTPDIVFPGRKKVVFVHGCFWHSHSCKRGARKPKTNASYWSNKLVRNQLRDQVTMSALTGMNWSYLIVWECEATNAGRCALLAKLVEFLR